MLSQGGGVKQLRPRRRPTLVRETESSGEHQRRRHKPDYWLLVICALLLSLGLVVVYSISPGLAALKGVGENYYVSKQIIAVLLGVASLIVTAWLPLNIWRKMTIPLVVLAIVGIIAAFLVPTNEITRAHRWIIFGGFSFQVAELMKFAVLICAANFIVIRKKQGLLNDQRATIKPLLIAIIVIGLIGIKLQSDLGSTAVILAMIGMMVFVAGIKLKKIGLVAVIVLLGLVLAIASSGYRRDRLSTFFHPERDCQSAGYQACQALIAVGSGGLFGLGLGHSVQAYGYLPEASNDSIFAIIAEKFGFVGVSLVIALYTVLIARLKRIIERTTDEFYKLIVVGVLAWISTQMIINIGAMIGLLPLKGITLPFVSYGGTSMVFLTAAIGLVFQISRYTSYGNTTNYEDQGSNNSTSRRRIGRAYNPNIVSSPRT